MVHFAIFLLVILGAFGAAELISLLLDQVYHKRVPEQKIVVLPLKGEVGDLEFRIRQIEYQHQKRWSVPDQIYVVDLGMQEESRRILSLLQRNIEGITICTEQELAEKIQQNLCLQSPKESIIIESVLE